LPFDEEGDGTNAVIGVEERHLNLVPRAELDLRGRIEGKWLEEILEVLVRLFATF